jgi:hypothetical protein
MDFWGFIAWFFWCFVFVAYLMVLFSILGDLFHDHTVNGWVKAIWVIFLIFVPFLTALIYLIARGTGMQKRGMAQAAAMRADQDAYIRATASSGRSPAEEIAKAKGLLDSGALTPAEFDALKAQALASDAPAVGSTATRTRA